MKIIKNIFLFLLGLVMLVLLLDMLPFAPKYQHENPLRVVHGERPLIIPHGGAKHLYPENTVYSFSMLNQEDYRVFEIDLCLTADGKLISHHDIDISRTTGLEGIKIIDQTYEQLTGYNFAQNFVDIDGNKPYEDIDDHQEQGLVPATLDYLFQNYPHQLYILELKDTIENSGEKVFIDAIKQLHYLIGKYDMGGNVIVASFDDEVIKRFKELTNNEIMTAAATYESLIFVVLSTVKLDIFYRPTDAALMLPIKDDVKDFQLPMLMRVPGFIRNRLFTYNSEEDRYYTNFVQQGIIDDAHRHNMAIFYWTVNDPDQMRMLIKMNVDGIITDRPDLMEEVLEEMGF